MNTSVDNDCQFKLDTIVDIYPWRSDWSLSSNVSTVANDVWTVASVIVCVCVM